jgi:hypothetical protein
VLGGDPPRIFKQLAINRQIGKVGFGAGALLRPAGQVDDNPITRDYNCKPGRTLVRSSAMNFQVVLQWPASSVGDFGGMVEIEELVAKRKACDTGLPRLVMGSRFSLPVGHCWRVIGTNSKNKLITPGLTTRD